MITPEQLADARWLADLHRGWDEESTPIAVLYVIRLLDAYDEVHESAVHAQREAFKLAAQVGTLEKKLVAEKRRADESDAYAEDRENHTRLVAQGGEMLITALSDMIKEFASSSGEQMTTAQRGALRKAKAIVGERPRIVAALRKETEHGT